MDYERTPDEIINEVLSRWTVTDLREMTDDDLDRGIEKAEQADIRILGGGEINLIRYWNIESGGKRYQVRRFENFVWCSCKDFFFNKTVCKHLAVTTRAFDRIRNEKTDKSPYLKPVAAYKGERVGNIRI